MEHALITVLNMSITASYVILAILLVRLLLKRAPKKFSYALWAAAAFRLVCPVSFTSGLSLLAMRGFSFTNAQRADTGVMTYVPQDIGMAAQPEVSVGLAEVSEAINGALPAATPQYSANPMQIWLAIAAWVWVVGIAVLAVYAIASYIVLYLRMRTAVRIEEGVFCSERVRSPFILGIFRPRMYLPYGLPDETKAYVLAHERYHLKHLDHLVKPLMFCIAAVHWFNPLVWLALILCGRDMELRTDEAVLAENADIRKAYSTVLLSFASNRRLPMPKPLAFGESGVKTRIKNALRWRKPKRAVSILCVCLTFAMTVACAANPPSNAVTVQTPATPSYFLSGRQLFAADGVYDDDSGCIYLIGEKLFVSFDRESGEVLSLSSGPNGFQWLQQEASYEAMMKIFASAGVEPLDRDYSDVTACPMGLDDGLARVEDELWLLLMDGNVLTDIYTLIPTERTEWSYGFNYLEWSYHGNLAASSFHGFFLGFDLDYESITATCGNGHLTRFDGLSYEPAEGDTLTLYPGDRLVWSPLTDLSIPAFEGTPTDTVELTITLASGAEVQGTLLLEGHQIRIDKPELHAKFFVRFDSDDLFMRADYDFGGGKLMPIEHHLSVLDYPNVN